MVTNRHFSSQQLCWDTYLALWHVQQSAERKLPELRDVLYFSTVVQLNFIIFKSPLKHLLKVVVFFFSNDYFDELYHRNVQDDRRQTRIFFVRARFVVAGEFELFNLGIVSFCQA